MRITQEVQETRTVTQTTVTCDECGKLCSGRCCRCRKDVCGNCCEIEPGNDFGDTVWLTCKTCMSLGEGGETFAAKIARLEAEIEATNERWDAAARASREASQKGAQ